MGEEHGGQYEDTVSGEQDEDYVNIEGRHCQEQYDDIDTLHPPECHLKRDRPGNGMFCHKHCIMVEIITCGTVTRYSRHRLCYYVNNLHLSA